MQLDPRRLKPSQLARLLNSTPLGEVTSERQLHRHRTRAGYRIGDGKHVDLFRYAAWLVGERRIRLTSPPTQDYVAVKERSRARSAAVSAAGRDIGELPPVADSDRKERAAGDFRFFCESYFKHTFTLPWSPDHLKVIAKVEKAVLEGGLFALAMPRASGKALALDTPLATPFGWTTMGDVQVGDLLFDEEGWLCRVCYATEVQLGRPCFRVEFSDGEAIVCDGDHLWTVEDRWSRRNPLTLTTAEMEDRVLLRSKRPQLERRYRVAMTEPLVLPEAPLDIDPYVLGYWLGDGTAANNNITVHRDDLDEVARAIRRAGESCSARGQQGQAVTCVVGKGHRADPLATRRIRTALAALDCHVPTAQAARWAGLTERSVSGMRYGRWESVRQGKQSSLKVRLDALGLIGNKHIPPGYLRAAPWQRLALLQGLMDTDGSVGRRSRCEITLKDDQLGRDIGDLLSGLGIRWTCATRYVERDGRTYGPYLRYSFTAYRDLPVFRMRRKLARLQNRPAAGSWSGHRQIIAITPAHSVPVRCIQVDSPSQLYLAGRKMVPTHNTTLVETACLWAVLTGARDFVCLIGSDEGHAMMMLDSIKTELESNEILAGDYPEVCVPLQCLERVNQRRLMYQGKTLRMELTAKHIVLPDMPGSNAAGAIINVTGITGRIRGMKHKRPDGKSVRPSLVVIDDPQTDESANSPSQCARRERTLAGAVLGLAGPGKKIAGIMPCTVIRPEDMADRILDRVKHPQWQGERTKMVYAWPKNEALWAKYAEFRAESLRAERGLADATEFYRQHRAAMDEGAVIAWPERFNHDELSAIQHAMNLRLQDEAAFFAEYQNEPLPEDPGESGELTADQIASKTNGLDRGVVPISCHHLTMFIDVQGHLLFYAVAAWQDDFTGYVLDYGAYPDQKRAYFTLRDAKPTLEDAAPGTGLEGSIHAALEALTKVYLAREWRRDDGATLRVARCLIDANWGTSTDVVYQFCRQSPHAAVLLPSHGKFVGASSNPFSEYRKKAGDQVGHNWRIPNVHGKRAVRYVLLDTNYWKSFLHTRLAVAMGDRGCLSLFGRKPEQHRLLAQHLTAEFRIRTEGRGRTVDEWKLRPAKPDNHWFDCLVGCAVAGSVQGISLAETGSAKTAARRERVRFSPRRPAA